ncbi:methionyl-tRNA formyltransferase [Pseudobutyrivibrio xylanivorans]|uniref:Methionyl-tRNA formyltransferase n=1 Tax=Pseudobutyrivibrio xylanivorans TaxID=185007 RepID=A0A1G5S4E9_PSEXY|nr:formyltransferase family protein [Pseudobutyrivibrio xylanivorans]SCZ81245.1 methionyl-tRNA formyltransferase [Pseudobutyrivibrio xylanivorans]
MVKSLLFAATEKGFSVCKRLVEERKESLGAVITFKEVGVQKDWSEDIVKLCKNNGVDVFYWSEIKTDLYNEIDTRGIDCAFAISWKYLISLDINNHLKHNLIVLHDSLLPRYRGFAPTPTAIINGEDKVGITALFATDSVDKGDILLQKEIKVEDHEYICDIIEKESEVYGQMVVELIDMIEEDNVNPIVQNEDEASYSIWRNLEDCHIDWDKPAKDIYNFVRALGNPYLGAYTYWDDNKIIIERASVMDYDLKFELRDSGKIWSIEDGMPIVICGSGLLKIQSAKYENGDKVTFNRVRVRFK